MSKKRLNILEIGSGQGFESNLISKNDNYKVTGIDISEDNIKEATKRFPQITFLKMDATKLKFPNNYFDKIYALDVLEHIDDLPRALLEIQRVIKRKGELIVNLPAEKSEYWLTKIRPSYFKEIHHVRIFKKGELEGMLKMYGFQLIKSKRTGFLKHIELYYLFTKTHISKSQLCIGSRQTNLMNKVVYAITILFDPACLNTPLKYIPIWLVTIPLGFVINSIGNQVMPKSIYYEFYKIK